MNNDFSKVSLGFAEFVSQLIHETFDAILESQNYQMDRYLELEKALNTNSTEAFKNKYLGDQEIEEFLEEEFGFIPKARTNYKAEIISMLKVRLSDDELAHSFNKNQLTEYGYNLIYQTNLEKLIDLKKSKLKMFVERPELARLIIDSGEIRTKLELYCLNESKPTTELKSKPAITSTTKKINAPVGNEVISKEVFKVSDISFGDLKAREIIDTETNQKTILIDKSSIMNAGSLNVLPTTRMVANPISSSKTTNIYSEVVIKFRSL